MNVCCDAAASDVNDDVACEKPCGMAAVAVVAGCRLGMLEGMSACDDDGGIPVAAICGCVAREYWLLLPLPPSCCVLSGWLTAEKPAVDETVLDRDTPCVPLVLLLLL